MILNTFNDMIAYGKKIKGYSFTPAELTTILRKCVGTDDIKLKTSRDVAVDLNQIVITGIYDPEEDESNFSSITLYVTYNPSQAEIVIKPAKWKQLCIDLLECLGHELIHQTQYRNRQFDIGPLFFASASDDDHTRNEQEYLANADEIEAYGYSIAVEIFLKHAGQELTPEFINKSPIYKIYVNAFGKEHVIVRQLVSFVVRFYSSIAIITDTDLSQSTEHAR